PRGDRGMVKLIAPGTMRRTVEELGRILRDHRLVLWSLVVLLLPFYVFDSGIPQIADFLGFVLLIVLLRSWNGRMPPTFIRLLQSLMMFIGYVFLVNLGWSVAMLSFSLDGKTGFLLAPTFYVFTGMMFFAFLLMFQRYGEYLLW